MHDFSIRELDIYGHYMYQIWVDGEVYDHFFSPLPLTWKEQDDVLAGYKEALVPRPDV